MNKLTKLRFYDKQAKHCEPLNDWLILAGKNAYQAYYGNKTDTAPNGEGMGDHWLLIRENFHLGGNATPCLLDVVDSPTLASLRLAPENQRFIKIFQVGDMPTITHADEHGNRDDFQTRILMNLATNNPHLQAVEWIDMGLSSENLTPLLERIKQGQDTTAEFLQKTTKTDRLRLHHKLPHISLNGYTKTAHRAFIALPHALKTAKP